MVAAVVVAREAADSAAEACEACRSLGSVFNESQRRRTNFDFEAMFEPNVFNPFPATQGSAGRVQISQMEVAVYFLDQAMLTRDARRIQLDVAGSVASDQNVGGISERKCANQLPRLAVDDMEFHHHFSHSHRDRLARPYCIRAILRRTTRSKSRQRHSI